MKFPEPANSNYAATIVKIPAIVPLKGRDRIVGIPLFGGQAIVSKGWEVGDLGVYFPPEVQFSHEYASANNLYRDATQNADSTETGYLEPSRRLKALKLGPHRSDAMFMPLSSLDFTGVNIGQLKEGDTFDQIDGHEICKKYEIKPVREPGDARQNKITKKFDRVDAKFLPIHIDSDNYWRNLHTIDVLDQIIVTQKLHGTSVRIGNTIVREKPRLRDKIAAKLGIRVQEYSYDNVYGSRKVIKDANNPNQQHHYGTDVWTLNGKKLDGLIPRGYVVYGELVGFTPEGAALQKNYTYEAGPAVADLYVYRVAFVSPDGMVTDLSWSQVKKFCTDRGLKHVPELFTGWHGDFDVDDWMDTRYRDLGYSQAVALSDPKLPDEGVCIRVEDGYLPRIYKAKSPAFLRHESAVLDEGVADIESVGASAE